MSYNYYRKQNHYGSSCGLVASPSPPTPPRVLRTPKRLRHLSVAARLAYEIDVLCFVFKNLSYL